MSYPQFKTVVLTSMFISVLFLTGCGRKEETKAVTEETNTPTIEQTTETPKDESADTSKVDEDDAKGSESTDQETLPTPAATTTPTDTTTATTQDEGRTYGSTYHSYATPVGSEEVQVVATIDGQWIVKKVALTFTANAPKSKTYQDLFAEWISEQVVGKSIKDVKVGVVNWSSLTAEWFNNAIDQIEKVYYGTTN